MTKTLNLYCPENPEVEDGQPCRDLADDTDVGDSLFVDGVGTFVIASIEGDDATLVRSADWREDGEMAGD